MRRTGRSELNVFEDRIIRIMRQYYDTLTVYEIAGQSGIHWETAKYHLNQLKKKKLVREVKKNKRTCWEALRPKEEDEL